MKVNNKEVKGVAVAFDGCHKIYVCEDDQDVNKAKEIGYNLYDIADLEKIYKNSCELRFISNWKLNTYYVAQFEQATFEK